MLKINFQKHLDTENFLIRLPLIPLFNYRKTLTRALRLFAFTLSSHSLSPSLGPIRWISCPKLDILASNHHNHAKLSWVFEHFHLLKFISGNGTPTKEIVSPIPHTLDSNGVWYSSFWSEGPKTLLNMTKENWSAALWNLCASPGGPRCAAPQIPVPPLEVDGTNFETKIFKFRLFLGPSNQNELSTTWGLGDRIFYGGGSF